MLASEKPLEGALRFAEEYGYNRWTDAQDELNFLREVERTARLVMEATVVFPGKYSHLGTLRRLLEGQTKSLENDDVAALEEREDLACFCQTQEYTRGFGRLA